MCAYVRPLHVYRVYVKKTEMFLFLFAITLRRPSKYEISHPLCGMDE